MMTGPVNPVLGSGRMKALRATLLELPARESFDRLVRLATKMLDVPVAFILIRDEDRFVVWSHKGFSDRWAQTADPAAWSQVGQATLAGGEPLAVSDIREHSLGEPDSEFTRAGIVALAGFPLILPGGDRAGILGLADTKSRSWTGDDFETLGDLVAPVMAEMELRAAAHLTGGVPFFHDPDERIKELTALHKIAGMLHTDRPVSEVLAAAATILQSAWQYPEITEVRVRSDAGAYATPNFRQTPWMQAAEFPVPDGTRGLIEVAYLEERSLEDEGPFLAEERSLIDSAAMLLRSYFERRRMERGLQALNQRTADILESISDAFYAVDEEWRFTYVNREAEQLWQRRREDLLGRIIWEEFPEAIGGVPYEAQHRAARERCPGQFEAPSPITHGWIEGNVYPGSSGLSVYFRDISEQKRSEAAFRESESRLRAIFEGAAIGIALVDGTGRMVQVNSAFCDMLGYTEGELRGRTFTQLTHPDDVALSWNVFEELTDGRRNRYQLEKRYLHKDGQVVWGWLTVSRFGEVGDDSAYFIGMIEDITWRKQIKQALRESEERFHAVNVLAGQANIGLDGRFLKVNQVCCEISGYDEKELLATDFQSIAHPDDRASSLDYLRNVLAGQGPSSPVEKRCIRKDGGVVTALISASVVRDAEGTPQSLICLVLDITERKRAEEEREQLLIREQVARAEAETAQQRIAFLAGASQFLAHSLDYEATLENIAQLAIPVLGDWCTVRILQQDGTLRSLAAAHADPEKLGLIRQLPAILYPPGPDQAAKGDFRSPAFAALETRWPYIDPVVTLTSDSVQENRHQDLLRLLNPRSVMILPLLARGRALGVITFVMADSGRHYSQDDLALAEELAHRAALAVDNARLFHETRQAEARSRQSAAQVRMLSEASRAFTEASLDFQTLLDTVTQRISDAVGDFCMIRMLSEDGEWLIPASFHHRDLSAQSSIRTMLNSAHQRSNEGPGGSVVQTGLPVRLRGEDLEAFHSSGEGRWASLEESWDVYSLLVVPLRVRGRNLGTLGIGRDLSPE
ncbi:PAS domain S-box protein, partial [Nitrolancea hollandica]|uniref:PAS domain S-box protein n=1 Tax=Nitrolancea hollandica TaxID=1206749 RepID=UPI000590F188